MKFSGTTKAGRVVDNHEILCISNARHKIHLELLSSDYAYRMILRKM